MANTRLVGAEVAAMVWFLNNATGTRNNQFHLVGHSLGAHVMGYAGYRLPGLARITGTIIKPWRGLRRDPTNVNKHESHILVPFSLGLNAHLCKLLQCMYLLRQHSSSSRCRIISIIWLPRFQNWYWRMGFQTGIKYLRWTHVDAYTRLG